MIAENHNTEGQASPTEQVSASTRNKKEMFLAAYVQTCNITRAAEAAGITRKSHYDWLKDDADYAARFDEAKEHAADELVTEARRRAIEGMRRYKFKKSGEPILHPVTGEPYYEDVRSDTLLIFLLKAARPEVYRDKPSEVNLHAAPVAPGHSSLFDQLPPKQRADLESWGLLADPATYEAMEAELGTDSPVGFEPQPAEGSTANTPDMPQPWCDDTDTPDTMQLRRESIDTHDSLPPWCEDTDTQANATAEQPHPPAADAVAFASSDATNTSKPHFSAEQKAKLEAMLSEVARKR